MHKPAFIRSSHHLFINAPVAVLLSRFDICFRATVEIFAAPAFCVNYASAMTGFSEITHNMDAAPARASGAIYLGHHYVAQVVISRAGKRQVKTDFRRKERE